ncbi:MAG TPA: inositol monophosphatase family protein [Vicinamibacterales bacterium]|nr:inositol monophosphatase family protein [Vicinamibacterales bacterium]
MTPPIVDIDAVTRLIEEVASEIVMPKFNALRPDDIHHKPTEGHASDIVTVVDRNAEERLRRGLSALLPGAGVLGEEAAHRDAALLQLVHDDGLVWIVDPLDGTANFAAGRDGFGIMVSLAGQGQVIAAWIHLPARREFFVAESGGGAFCNGARMWVPPVGGGGGGGGGAGAVLRGALFTRYMPADLRDAVIARTAGRVEVAAHTGAAAIEYTEIARGRKAFAIYYRLLPWDHGAPALVLTESGGCVEHLDGRRYGIRSPNQLTLVAQHSTTAQQLRQWLTSSSPESSGEHAGAG